MDLFSRISIQYKLVLPWLLPILGLVYAAISTPSGVMGNALIITALLCAAGLVATWLIGHKVLTTIAYATKSANATANRDFNYEPPMLGKDELAHLIYTMVNLRNSIRHMGKGDSTSSGDAMLSSENAAKVDAISKSQAVIEFNLDGTIITANENFLGAVGYSLEEIKGKHHSLFVEPAYKESQEYKDFWAKSNHKNTSV